MEGDDTQAVIDAVEKAFAGVTLGKGIGLYQGHAIDGHMPEEHCLKMRERDEKDDWHAIAPEELECHSSSLSFFDPLGMRFHLPAYLIGTLQHEISSDVMAFQLTHLTDYSRNQFSLLNPEQRAAVRTFLQWALTEEDYLLDIELVNEALNDYWTAP